MRLRKRNKTMSSELDKVMQAVAKTGKEERLTILLPAQTNQAHYLAPKPCDSSSITSYFENKTDNSEAATQAEFKENTQQNNNPTTNNNSNYANEGNLQAAKTVLIGPESTLLPTNALIWGHHELVAGNWTAC